MLKYPDCMEEILLWQNSRTFLAKFLLHCYEVSDGHFQRALVDESGMIRTHDGEA
jgi:hypothetical protein